MNILFQTQTIYTYQEYHHFNLAVQKYITKVNRTFLYVALVVLAFAAINCWMGDIIAGIVLGIVAVLVPFALNRLMQSQEKKLYDKKAVVHNLENNIFFYEEHVEQWNKLGHTTAQWDQLFHFIETDTHFYLMISKLKGIIVVKANCSPELVSWLQEKRRSYLST